MTQNLMIRLSRFIQNLETLLPQLFGYGGHPPSALALAGMPSAYSGISTSNDGNKFSLKEILGDGILWAVPKHRRSVEKRLNRKFGYPEYVWKPLKIKTNLEKCRACGHDKEAGVLCPNCYSKIKKETELMQETIQQELGLDPVDKEVVVLYEGERNKDTDITFKGKRIVEMKKPRPMWFTKNLLQKSTVEPADSKEVKPSDLG